MEELKYIALIKSLSINIFTLMYLHTVLMQMQKNFRNSRVVFNFQKRQCLKKEKADQKEAKRSNLENEIFPDSMEFS